MEQRFPQSLYSSGDEPDPRFTLANERTFLAWVRTSLALLAVAGALLALDLPLGSAWQWSGSLVFAIASLASACWAWVAWLRTERRLRQNRPLPGLGWGGGVSVLLVAGVLVLVLGLFVEVAR